MPSVVMLPSRFDVNAVDQFTRQFVDQSGFPTDTYFVFDFKRLGFIDGSGITVLRNSISWLQTFDCKINFDNFDNIRRDSIKYLDDCGFFYAYLKKYLRVDARCRSTTLPCMYIERSHSYSFIDRQLSPWLASTLYVDEKALASFRSCIKEIFNNINDHSTKTTGFIHVQHYPYTHRVKITVSDFGVGIPSTIRRQYGEMSDSQAIKLAAEEGITSKSQPSNMGAGLNYLLDCISLNRGEVILHSQSGFLRCSSEKGVQTRKAFNRTGRYPGTLVDISIDDRLFVGDEYEDDRGVIEW